MTVLITGVPRSGTTLCCSVLNQHKNTVALHEPIPASRFVDVYEPDDAVMEIRKFSLETYKKIKSSHIAPTKQKDGTLPTNPVEEGFRQSLRKEVVSLGEIKIVKELEDPFVLAIKHNALFASLLVRLDEHFRIYGIVRNPLSLICSWRTVDLPVSRGRVPMGERFDANLRDRLIRAKSVTVRQLIVIQWFFERFRNFLSPDRILRYEDVVLSKGCCLSVISGDPDSPVDLNMRYEYGALNILAINEIRDALTSISDSFGPWYSKKDILDEAERVLDAST